ncbi:DinB superfamily protein [Paenibacillus uliginis N3/975]|uniref:DinB superfamily protein n=1 Tax=Paenibacillus uliginis N3/975 TaxID=1313296 RepID=A0A1X7HFY0_9BACL|nr:DinB family protein [Paenibacillus uliginis]SMF86026.1 DinB superfamily protein [Paenibacillus uliginis N3/975]
MNLEQRKAWNANHKQLTNIITKPAQHHQAVQLFLKQHALLYSSKMTGSELQSLEDELLTDIKEETFRTYPVRMTDTSNSIIWHIWHSARIEDMTMNILVNDSDQVLMTEDWQHKMKVPFHHSGNDMLAEEVALLSAAMDIEALLLYRIAVGRRTREIIQSLQPGQLKQKVESARLQKLIEQGAVNEKSQWLVDYWGGKTIAGLVLMPATRHHFIHLNRSIRIKHKVQ